MLSQLADPELGDFLFGTLTGYGQCFVCGLTLSQCLLVPVGS